MSDSHARRQARLSKVILPMVSHPGCCFGYDGSEMSIAPLPTPLQHLGGRRFSFYPPIRNIAHNEWLYRRATWSECVVANMLTGEEIWIPRMFLGEVSRVDEAVMIVSLHRELEWRAGLIIPHERTVIEFPIAVNDNRAVPRPGHLAPVINIRLEPKTEVRAWRWIGVAAVLGACALAIVADFTRQTTVRPRPDFFRGYRAYLQLGPDDDYASVVRRLGAPARSESVESGARVFRSLDYPWRRYSVVLMGTHSIKPRYIGTLDPSGRVLDTVRLTDGTSSESVLNSPLAAGLR